MSYSQINDIEKIKDIMVKIGKDDVITSFENEIGISWKDAKMKNFYVCGLKNKAVLYYLDGKYKFGSLVMEFDKSLII